MEIDGRCLRMMLSRSASRRLRLPMIPLLVALFLSEVKSLSYNSFGSILKDDIFPPSVNPSDQGSVTKGYWCDYCSCGFNKHKSLVEHLEGRRHKAVVAEGDIVWKDYIAHGRKEKSSPSLSSESVFFDESVTKMDVARAWSLDKFMDGLPARSRSSKKKLVASGMVGNPGFASGVGRSNASSSSSSSFLGNNSKGGEGNQIDPRLRLGDLPPSKRAALFRYLHVTSSGIPGLIDMVSAMPPKYVRVKELLESLEVYYHVVYTILKRSTQNGRKAKRLSRVYDVGCGHGLVGMLIAASYPGIDVRSIDLVPRESFLAQSEAFESTGTAMDNLAFETGDLSVVSSIDQREGDNDGHNLMLCVHGCKELTHESIELARDRGWAWLAVPCCLQAGDHLDRVESMHVSSDHTRYAMLCGAIAGKYRAETVTTIDGRITGRGIVLASSDGE